ncbi:hypothetical protein ABPG77_010225 [Micractinium sp. CCAP 211/92]
MRATILNSIKGHHPFKPFMPSLDFLPLFTVFGTAMGVVAYCSYRAITLNPDVHLSATHKHDELHESGITLKRAEAYYDSIFRKAWHARTGGDGETDTKIHL